MREGPNGSVCAYVGPVRVQLQIPLGILILVRNYKAAAAPKLVGAGKMQEKCMGLNEVVQCEKRIYRTSFFFANN